MILAKVVIPTRVRWNIVALLVAFSVQSYFDRVIMSIAGPSIIREFSISETAMGTVFSAFILSYAIVMTFAGSLADRIGVRAILGLMGLGSALFTAITAVAASATVVASLGIIPALIAVRLCMGVFQTPMYPSSAKATVDWMPPHNRAWANGLVCAGAGLGGALASPVFSMLISRFGWRDSFYFAAASTALLSLVWIWYARDNPAEHPGTNSAERELIRTGAAQPPSTRHATRWRLLLRNRNVWLLTISYFAVDYFEYIFFYWMFYYLGQVRKMSPSESMLYTTGPFIALAVMTPIGGLISDYLVKRYGTRFGRRSVAIVSMALSALLLFVGASTQNLVGMVAVMSLALGCIGCAEGPFWASIVQVGGTEAGAAAGLFNAGGNLGGTLSPTLTPLVASYFGWTWGLTVGSLVCLAGMMLWFFIDPADCVNETSC